MTKQWTILAVGPLLVLLALCDSAPLARADIFQWEYIDPADPGQGKRQSTTLAPDGAGVNAEPGAYLANRNLTMAYLIGADLGPTGIVVDEEGYPIGYESTSNLTGANLSQADLTSANLLSATLTGVDFTDAEVRGAVFARSAYGLTEGTGITAAQLYSTHSYERHDLTGIHLHGNVLSGVNLVGQNLTSASFFGVALDGADLSQADLTNANFTYASLGGANLSGAEVRGASFSSAGLTIEQLYATASYQAKDLTGIALSGDVLTGANLSDLNLTEASFQGARLDGANMTRANLTVANFQGTQMAGANMTRAKLTKANFSGNYFYWGGANLNGANLSYADLRNATFSGDSNSPGADLTGANLTGADARGAGFYRPRMDGAITTNLIQSDGHIDGLDLTGGDSLVVRDYDENSGPFPNGPLPVVVEQFLTMDTTGTLWLVFDADLWDSTISFAPGISVSRGGTLELTFAPEVNLATQIGRTIDLFGWTGVTPTGAFTVSSPYMWDLSNLYTTGEVKLTAIPTLPGDFNNDGAVNAADYVFWRKNGGSADDYNDWRANFGASLGVGSGSALPSAEPLSAAVPEPATLVFCVSCFWTTSIFAFRKPWRDRSHSRRIESNTT